MKDDNLEPEVTAPVPSKQDGAIPPANGFTRRTRYALSVGCGLAFFSIIIADYGLAVMAREVPSWLYVLLFCGAAAGFDPVFNAVSYFTGGKR